MRVCRLSIAACALQANFGSSVLPLNAPEIDPQPFFKRLHDLVFTSRRKFHQRFIPISVQYCLKNELSVWIAVGIPPQIQRKLLFFVLLTGHIRAYIENIFIEREEPRFVLSGERFGINVLELVEYHRPAARYSERLLILIASDGLSLPLDKTPVF